MKSSTIDQPPTSASHRHCRLEFSKTHIAIATFCVASLAGCNGSVDGDRTIVAVNAEPSISALRAGAPVASAPSASAPLASLPISVSAGSDVTLTLPDSIAELNGSVNGGKAEWAQISGPNTAVFKSTVAPATAVVADKAGVYVLQLTGSNASGVSKSSRVTVTVKPNPTVLNATSTPLDQLKAINRPVFKKDHTLLPLSQSHCGIAPDISIELMKHWGYNAIVARVDNGPITQEVKANPGRYNLEVALGNLVNIDYNYDGRDPSLPVMPASYYLRDENGAFILRGGQRIISPAAPDEVVNIFADHVGRNVAQIEASFNQPIKLIQNSGEYGVWLFGDFGPQFHGRDPAVVAAYLASGLDWHGYNSREKARHERLIKAGIFNKLKKDRPIYNVYQESYGGERGRWGGWPNYVFRIEPFFDANGRPTVSDYSSPEMYYKLNNSGWTGFLSMQPWDGLTQSLKNIGGTIKLGQRHIYPWVSAGWDGGQGSGGESSSSDMFMGMMKSMYTLGALGATSGYFTCEGPKFNAMRLNQPVGTELHTQVRGLSVLSQTHALFSHLEDYLRNGDLLPGNGNHPYTAAGEPEAPSMEFMAVGETEQQAGQFGPVTVRTARVLARKIKNEDRWLISAWASTGVDREVRVTIDAKLGELKLQARKAGSIYIAEIKNGVTNLRLVDEDGMNPTRGLFP
jgi:hypothetical protein